MVSSPTSRCICRPRNAILAALLSSVAPMTTPLWRALQFREVVDASLALAPAKLTKSLDELECIRQAQAINERAMRTVRATVAAGVPGTTLSGTFLREIAELGASANVVDPVFNVMPASVAAGPYSVTRDPVFPLPTQPRVLEHGDVLW